MGMLVDGEWQAQDISGFVRDGQQVRFDSGFHGTVSATADDALPPAPQRYALYCNWTCPWSHRALVTRALKGLEEAIDLVLLEPAMGKQSWWFGESSRYRDPALGATHLHELYVASNPAFTGRVSIPVLWDKQQRRIVSNDSGAIARMFNDEFNEVADHPEVDFYPPPLSKSIDELNEFVGDRLTDGVYRCLLANSQQQYEQAFDSLFEALEHLDRMLSNSRFLLADVPTEPDWRLFACLIRFDSVYYSAYGCNLKRIVDFAHLWDYTRDLFQLPGVARTVDIDEMKAGYYAIIQPNRPVPKGPALDLEAPHNRGRLTA
ncbi:MAG: glutathione S-transferase C-terminal domain-containing protein [Pseudomonadota bacterium]